MDSSSVVELQLSERNHVQQIGLLLPTGSANQQTRLAAAHRCHAHHQLRYRRNGRKRDGTLLVPVLNQVSSCRISEANCSDKCRSLSLDRRNAIFASMIFQLLASILMIIPLYIYHGYSAGEPTPAMIKKTMEYKEIAIGLLYISRFLSGWSAGEDAIRALAEQRLLSSFQACAA